MGSPLKRHKHTYIYTYIRTHIHTYVRTCIHTCTHTHIHTLIHTIHTYTIVVAGPLMSHCIQIKINREEISHMSDFTIRMIRT